MGLALITDPQSFTLSSFKSSLGWKGGCLLIFRGKHCSLSNAARLYEELLIKWIHPAAETNRSAKKAGRRQKGYFQATEGFCLHCLLGLGSGLFSNENFKARLLGVLHRSKELMLQMGTKSREGLDPKNLDSAILRSSRSSPQSIFHLAYDLWGVSLQPSMKVLHPMGRCLLKKN